MSNIEETTVEQAPKKTREERIAELEALKEKEIERHQNKMAYYDKVIESWRNKGDKLAGVEFSEGNVVAFTYGRPGHPMRDLQGRVLGFKTFEKGGVFCVIEAGEGADKEIVKIRPSQVTSVLG